jgi:hypothetical protein
MLVFGTLSGAIVIAASIAGYSVSDGQGFFGTAWFGYLVMLIALSMIFIGIKRYRDNEQGGVVGFGQAAKVGVGIAAVAGVIYVVVWEIYLAATGYGFYDTYAAGLIEAARASGLTGEALQAEISNIEEQLSQYGNPLIRLPLTFLEIFPVGLLIALISAAILRKPTVLPAQA